MTGFGLLGHGLEMARASGTRFVFEAAGLPALPGALDLAAAGVETGGAAHNRRYVAGSLDVAAGVPTERDHAGPRPADLRWAAGGRAARPVAPSRRAFDDAGVERWWIGRVEAGEPGRRAGALTHETARPMMVGRAVGLVRSGAQSTTIPNGAAPPGIANGEPSSSLSDVPSIAKALTFATPASTTYRESPSGDTWASNGRRPAGLEKPVEPMRVRRAVRRHRVARDRWDGRVDGEQGVAIGAHRDPARGRLEVRERGAGDRIQRPVGGDVVDRDGPGVRAVVRVGHEQLVAVGRREAAAERPDPLRGERRARGGREPAIAPDAEPVEVRRPGVRTDPGADEPAAIRADQDVTGQRVVRQVEGRSADVAEVAAGVEPEPGVVAAARAPVGHVDEAAVDGDAHRARAMRCLDLDELEPAVRLDPEDGDLVRGRIRGEQVATVGAPLETARRAVRSAGAGTARVERRPGDRRQRPVGVAIERGDRVVAAAVVVDVDMADGRRTRGRRGADRQGRGDGGDAPARPKRRLVPCIHVSSYPVADGRQPL